MGSRAEGFTGPLSLTSFKFLQMAFPGHNRYLIELLETLTSRKVKLQAESEEQPNKMNSILGKQSWKYL